MSSLALSAPPTLPVQIANNGRLLKMKEMFTSRFSSAPKFYVRAPGRVNLIGEHIDYCGYAVLPMAIEQDIMAAVEPVKQDIISLTNTNPMYLDFSVCANSIEIETTKPVWHNYFLCGLKGIQEEIFHDQQDATTVPRRVLHCIVYATQDHFNFNKPTGMNCLVDGTIPPSSGLSSSSALVCCAGLVTLTANEKKLSKVELAEICAKSERYIGTEGGGMDQSISFLAEAGTAKLIEFNPLRATDVKLPKGAVFVIANSCVEMNKAATSHFNIRVMECRLATKFLAKSRGLEWKSFSKLGDVQTKMDLSLEEMLRVVEEELHPEPYSRAEICDFLGISVQELCVTILSQNTQDVTSFKLYQRAKHVYSEAQRVLDFKKVCDEVPEDAVQRLGGLMNQSHDSCRDLYECSCPELDQLVDICLQCGAIGSRLTGAGWGGCTVSMVPAGQQDEFISKVQGAYYKGERLSLLKSSIFATKPGNGAVVYLDAENN